MFSKFKKSAEIDLHDQFSNWIMNMNGELEDHEKIIALNFGIIETLNSYSIYLTGSNEYDESDSDWACNEHFVAKEKYFTLNLKASNSNDWAQTSSLVENLIRTFISSSEFNGSILNKVKFITFGFDDGDLTRIK